MYKYNFIHERGDYPPLAIEEIASNWSGDIKKTVGSAESPLFTIYKNGWLRMYAYEKNYQKIVSYVFDKISKDKNFVARVKNTFNQRASKFLDFVKKLEKINWPKLSNQELIKIKAQYVRLYHQTAPFGETLPYFLKEKLQTILDEHLIKEKNISEKERQILMTPLYQSFLNQEAEELYKIAARCKAKPSELKKAVKKHQKKYAWLLFDYASLVTSEKYFLEKAQQFLKNPPKIPNYRQLKEKKQQIIKKYKITPLFVYYLNLIEDLFYLMDKKKEVLTKVHFAITPLYKETARRLGTDLNTLYWFFWQEVKAALLDKNEINAKTARERKKSSVVAYINGHPGFLTPARAQKVVADIDKDQLPSGKEKIIKGIAASSGKAQGQICYLKSARENSKIKKGQILLVSNTTPDFMPAIQKASAIITNEGGLTCHAAIVSRELHIPCIVGTKIATQILKDGQMVEVNADKGRVKIIRNS